MLLLLHCKSKKINADIKVTYNLQVILQIS